MPLKGLLAALAALLVVLLAPTAGAHQLSLSRGDYVPRGPRVAAQISLFLEEAALAAPGLDANGDGVVTDAEIASARPALEAALVRPLVVEADGAACEGALVAASRDLPDGLHLEARYDCPREPGSLRLRFGFLDRLTAGHRHLATVHLPRGEVDELAVLASPELQVDVGAPPSENLASFVRAGVEHILTGADHLAFLLALVLGGTLLADRRTRVGTLLAMLTAFTIGHSASLAVATVGGLAPGARFVEPAVALSVAYVGGENLVARGMRHRWMLTLPFGFVHGFAFAGGLLPLGLPRAELPLALLGFNLGVEAGQLLVLGLLLPPLALLRSRTWYAKGAQAVSAAIALAGLVWFFQRVA